MRSWRSLGLVVVGSAVLVGCVGPQAPARQGVQAGDPGSGLPASVKRINAAMMGNPPTPYEKVIGGGSGGRIPGITGLEQLVAAGLTILDRQLVLRPQLAEAVPSIENGLWKVLPDGRMETTWKIRPGVRWHDGAPYSSDDVVFTTRIDQDRDLPVERNPAYTMIERIEAPDPQTVTVTWKRAYIEADDLFTKGALPKHILERPYTENKESFTALPYWNTEFVGTGPYRVSEWVRDQYVVLAAWDQYPLGRPKIHEIVVKFIPDENAFMANILSGGVDVTLGKSITLEQSLQLKSQWQGGRIEIIYDTAMKIWPQFINPNPAVVGDLSFRRAMFHAIHREELVDTIMGGLSQVAHTVVLPSEPEFAEVQGSIVKYEYDPRKAALMIEALGYTRGADGGFRDSPGRRLSLEISATDSDQNTKPMFAVSNYWQRIGVEVDSVVIPVQRQRDREYRATFPGFTLQGGGSGVARLKELHSSQARLPENNFTGGNYSRYTNAEFDARLDRFTSTIPRPERLVALREVIHHMTDQLNMMNLFYAAFTSMIGNRVQNAGADPTWNAQEWDIN